MTLVSYADSVLSLLPPVAAIVLAILTRRVLLSLGFGILAGALLLNQWSVIASGHYLVGLGLMVKGLVSGARSMLPAIYILMFAWTLAGIIGQLETGKFMASLASGNIPFALLPAVMFVLAGLTAFSTGTSWGTFGIMLPIAADMAMGSHAAILLPMLAVISLGGYITLGFTESVGLGLLTCALLFLLGLGWLIWLQPKAI